MGKNSATFFLLFFYSFSVISMEQADISDHLEQGVQPESYFCQLISDIKGEEPITISEIEQPLSKHLKLAQRRKSHLKKVYFIRYKQTSISTEKDYEVINPYGKGELLTDEDMTQITRGNYIYRPRWRSNFIDAIIIYSAVIIGTISRAKANRIYSFSKIGLDISQEKFVIKGKNLSIIEHINFFLTKDSTHLNNIYFIRYDDSAHLELAYFNIAPMLGHANFLTKNDKQKISLGHYKFRQNWIFHSKTQEYRGVLIIGKLSEEIATGIYFIALKYLSTPGIKKLQGAIDVDTKKLIINNQWKNLIDHIQASEENPVHLANITFLCYFAQKDSFDCIKSPEELRNYRVELLEAWSFSRKSIINLLIEIQKDNYVYISREKRGKQYPLIIIGTTDTTLAYLIMQDILWLENNDEQN